MIPTLPCRAVPARDWDRLPLADRASACQSCPERTECYEGSSGQEVAIA